jgi:hypothetical protein
MARTKGQGNRDHGISEETIPTWVRRKTKPQNLC